MFNVEIKLCHRYVCVGKNMALYIESATICDFRHALEVLECICCG
jgi:hypothetical protein